MPNLKVKACKDCKEQFHPFKALQPRCYDCAISKGKQDAQKQREKTTAKKNQDFNKETRRRKLAIKGKKEFKKEAQTAFNAFIRERDKHQPCISCLNFTHDRLGGGYDAGHYRSRGSTPELAFEELNCHKQCKKCNNQLSGNITNYRIHLIKRIGIDNLDWVEGPHELTRHTKEDYIEIKAKYKNKLKDLQKCTV